MNPRVRRPNQWWLRLPAAGIFSSPPVTTGCNAFQYAQMKRANPHPDAAATQELSSQGLSNTRPANEVLGRLLRLRLSTEAAATLDCPRRCAVAPEHFRFEAARGLAAGSSALGPQGRSDRNGH